MDTKTSGSLQPENNQKRGLQHWQMVTILLVGYDVLAVAGSYFLGLWIRYDFQFSSIPGASLKTLLCFIPLYAAFVVVVFWLLRLYKSIWRFAGYSELLRMILATALTASVHLGGMLIFQHFMGSRMPISYYVVGAVLQFISTLGIRFLYRFVLLLRGRKSATEESMKRVMLIGAGEAGQIILRDIKGAKETNEKVVCIIDDNPNKHGRFIDNIPIVGSRQDIPDACKKFEVSKIYVAIPSATPGNLKDILNICKDTGCEIRNLPGMYQFMTGEVSLAAMREVSVEDLLGRDPVKVDLEEISRFVRGKSCLITGGGGSIGSELARQIAAQEPEKLILLDVYENNVYDIQQELKKRYPKLELIVVIGSVRDSRKMFSVFEKYRPELVFHAAAHKHVPLMEDSPCEAIKNNTIGTYKTAFAAMAFGCRRFVLISTDKAVNPTNIMGASKRLCEMVVQAFNQKVKEGKAEEIPQLFTHWADEGVLTDRIRENLKSARTEFVAVRFGNVLDSNGSVIPLFKKQIAEGGPVTVTHPDIIRYFMTIPEAVSLVLEAGAYAKGGEIFVLDMGEPMKIDTLARNLIILSGHTPDGDIKIKYIGLRPGEKLYEERLMAEEGLKQTENAMIHIGEPIPFDQDEFFCQLKELMILAYKNNADIRKAVEKMVPTYHCTGTPAAGENGPESEKGEQL